MAQIAKKKSVDSAGYSLSFQGVECKNFRQEKAEKCKKKWREHSYRSNSPGTDPDRKNAYLQKSLDGVAHLAIFGNTTCAAMSFSDIL